MNNQVNMRISEDDYKKIHAHLFPGDHDEHGLVLLAGMSLDNDQVTLHVREIHLAKEGVDYVNGKIGHRALAPSFIHRMITRARDEKLVYLAVHNHSSDLEVGFSKVDFQSHERGYPALLQIAKGMPVGALVFGFRSLEADIWLPNHERLNLKVAQVIGNSITELRSRPEKKSSFLNIENYDRQIKLFGSNGQFRLAKTKVVIVGLGGIGSLVAEYLSKLGIGHFVIIDDDKVETSNLSRIVGANENDVIQNKYKTEIAYRVIKDANPSAIIEIINDDFSKESVALRCTSSDYIFLAADSMRARLVFNAIIHQYLIPGVQLGSKIRSDSTGNLLDAISANRPVRPGHGCLWCNQLIDTTILAKEAKSDAERKAQAYGVEESNPSVITLNAISAAHAVNDFLFDFLALRTNNQGLNYEHFYHLKNSRSLVEPRKDDSCSECSTEGLRFAKGDSVKLPCMQG